MLYTIVGRNYMKKSVLFTTSFVTALCLVFSSGQSVSAQMYQEQRQSVSNSSSFSYSCDGDCNGTAESKTSSKVKQSQSQGYGTTQMKWRNNRNYRNNRNWNTDRDTSGEVSLSWDQRGGTCHVRYTESWIRNYKYSTSTACDNGSITIGGLQPGTSYRFEVQKDSEGWSWPLTLRAN